MIASRSVLVTGATGFVGSAIVRRLLTTGHQVTGLVRSVEAGAGLAKSGVQVEVGEMSRPATYEHLVARVDAVIHAAQHTPVGRLSGKKMAAVRAADHAMTEALAAACIRAGRRLIYTSGVFNYGDHGDAWIDEATPFSPSPMGVGHAREVAMLRDLRLTQGLDCVTLAPGFVIGPGGLFKASFYDQVKQSRLRVIGSGANYWSCVQVDDLASAYVLALDRAPSGAEYNVVDDSPVTLRELVDAVTDGLGAARVGNIPPWIMSLLIGGPLVESLVTSFRIRNAKVRSELGWAPRCPSIRESVPQALAVLTG